MRPLVLLVLAEFVVLVLLAMQWLGSGTTALAGGGPAPRTTPPTEAAAPVAAATTPTKGEAPASAQPERHVAAEQVPAVAAGDAFGIIVSGTIRGSDGKLVEGANVYLRRDREGRSSNSAGAGCYAIVGLQPGEWTLTCRAEGYAPYEAPCVLDERAFQQVDVELRTSYVVRVKVLNADGESIVGELEHDTMWGMPYVVATEAPLAGDLPPTEHSRLTRFGLGEWKDFHGPWARDISDKLREQGYAGELRMHRAPPAYASLLLRSLLLQSQRIEVGQKELVFTIEAKDVLGKHGTVKLRVVHGVTGDPIADVAVNVRTSAGGGSHAKTGADGRVSVEHVVPGLGMFEVQRGADREGTFRYVIVPPGGTVDLGDVTLTALEKITGTVVDADGKPANGASVQWTELDCRTFPQPLVDYISSGTEADGKFQLWGCGRHRYVVFARLQDGRFGSTTVDATAGAPAGVTITLGTPTKVALKAHFDMTVGYVVTALAKDRSPAAVATLGTEYRPESMLLPPGSYTIEIHDLTTHRLARSFALQVGSEPLAIDVP